MNTNPLSHLLQSALRAHEESPTQRNWGMVNALSYACGQWECEGGDASQAAASIRRELLCGDLNPEYEQGVQEVADSIEWL